ncbi:hypothetical protein [Streptomyces antimycoticus]|uniref:hypothetical protein n=1 Tax=Streptomyces antimycoticus TaxID=68175 RepID=UPI003F4DD623
MSAAYRVLESRRLSDDIVLGFVAVEFSFTDRPSLGVNLGLLLRRPEDDWLSSHYQVSRLD